MTEENDAPRPWERQKGEGDKPFAAFATYRDMGPTRTIDRVAELLGRSASLYNGWSSKFSWKKRCSAWDDEADRLQRERDVIERSEAIRTMRDNHARLGAAATQVAAGVLRRYGGDSQQALAALADLTAADAARLMQVGSNLERLSRGESTERIEIREAQKWVDAFVELALGYIDPDSHDAFLVDVDAKLGLGVASVPAPSADDPRGEG